MDLKLSDRVVSAAIFTRPWACRAIGTSARNVQLLKKIMDATHYIINKRLAAEEDKLLVLAKAVYALLRQDSTPLTDDEMGELRYKLDEAFNFEL